VQSLHDADWRLDRILSLESASTSKAESKCWTFMRNSPKTSAQEFLSSSKPTTATRKHSISWPFRKAESKPPPKPSRHRPQPLGSIFNSRNRPHHRKYRLPTARYCRIGPKNPNPRRMTLAVGWGGDTPCGGASRRLPLAGRGLHSPPSAPPPVTEVLPDPAPAKSARLNSGCLLTHHSHPPTGLSGSKSRVAICLA
jgi:hypothetical protein